MKSSCIALLCALTTAAFATAATAQDVTLRVTHEMAAQDAINIAAQRFAERVAERTGGRIDVKVFPAAQLGHDNDTMEQTKLGADMIVITNPGGAAPKEVPDLSILDGPYLFHSMADYRKLVKSDWFKSVSDRLEKEAGLKLLAANWLFGVRHVLTDPAGPFTPIDPVGWVTHRRYMEQDFHTVLERFLSERGSSLAWLNELQDPKWTQVHVHPTIGPLSAEQLLANWVAHDLLHFRQINALRYGHLATASAVSLAYAGTW